MPWSSLVIPLLVPLILADVRIGGNEFVPKDVIFGASEPRSRASSEGPLPSECKWTFVSETSVARAEEPNDCLRYFYKTVVTLVQTCADKPEQRTIRSSERITASPTHCPDKSGRIAPPDIDAKVLSSGRTADGRKQDVVVQPDGTRVVIASDDKSVTVDVQYPDLTRDVMRFPAPKK